LAYTAYYGSFITGWLIVDRLRFHHHAVNVQSLLTTRFGRPGSVGYNVLVTLRLLSEVFANLLVVGIVFGAAGTGAYNAAILGVAAVTLLYSMSGGLRASLRTDVIQMTLLIVILAALFTTMVGHPLFDASAVVTSSADAFGPGWVLLLVALLQVWSYPLHDPVMMDRGFIADRATTRRSFLHAFWISALCILAFGLLGVFAGLNAGEGEGLLATLSRLLGPYGAIALGAALIISAASTLDSTLSSAAKLVVKDMGLSVASARNGRAAMGLFCALGLVLVLLGPDDLFAAVAVSGTAALFLAPVIVCCIWGDRDVAQWSFVTAAVAAFAGAAVYFLVDAGHLALLERVAWLAHKYELLLAITIAVLTVGFAAFALGLRGRPQAVADSG
jgi:Na+/proline symporter